MSHFLIHVLHCFTFSLCLLLLHILYGSGFSERCPVKLEAVGLCTVQADAGDVVDIVILRRQHVQ